MLISRSLFACPTTIALSLILCWVWSLSCLIVWSFICKLVPLLIADRQIESHRQVVTWNSIFTGRKAIEAVIDPRGTRSEHFKWLMKSISLWSKFETCWRSVTCARNTDSRIKHLIVQTSMKMFCPFTSNCIEPFTCRALFCPPVIIRTILERNIMIAIWPFCSAWTEPQRELCFMSGRVAQEQKSLWMAGNCNNKEIEWTRKHKKHLTAVT